jgi:hypothetical protein
MENMSHDISWATGAMRPLFRGFTIKQGLKFRDISPFTVERRHTLLKLPDCSGFCYE